MGRVVIAVDRSDPRLVSRVALLQDFAAIQRALGADHGHVHDDGPDGLNRGAMRLLGAIVVRMTHNDGITIDHYNDGITIDHYNVTVHGVELFLCAVVGTCTSTEVAS